METVQQPELITEKSFDVLASVRAYQYDLETVGYIHPETRRRVFEEELSYIAEGINRPNYTEFALQERDGELVYFHKGEWRPYLATLITGLLVAEAEAALDPRRGFEAGRRAEDLRRGYQLQGLQPGEKLAWYYGFPHHELAEYGGQFMESLGFYPERAMGYLCEAEKTAGGRLILRHQSVDNSDEEAFAAAMQASRAGGAIEAMTEAYDAVLASKTGRPHYAGRPVDTGVQEGNAWSEVTRHSDLIEYFMGQIEALASQSLSDRETETAKKRLTYGVWARIREKCDEQSMEWGGLGTPPSGNSIGAEVESAYAAAAGRGEVLFGCGGSITGEQAILSTSAKNVFESIFGKKMSCPFCGASQYGDPCASRLYCPSCTAEVRDGKVISDGRARSVKKGILEIVSEEWAAWNRQYDLEEAQKKRQELGRRQSDAGTPA